MEGVVHGLGKIQCIYIYIKDLTVFFLFHLMCERVRE